MIERILPSLPTPAGYRVGIFDGATAASGTHRKAVRLLPFEGDQDTRTGRSDTDSDPITIEGWADAEPWFGGNRWQASRDQTSYGLYLPFLVQHLAQEALPSGLHRERWSEGIRAYRRADAAGSAHGQGIGFAA